MSILLADPRVSHQRLQLFLERWPVEVIMKMSLNDYSMAGNRDTFTYWLEFGSEELGRIGGAGTFSSMYGIWNKSARNEKDSRGYLTDGIYKWHETLGDVATTAFGTVRDRILDIIGHSQSGNFHLIDDINLHSFVRWKIAFIYSNYSLLPIYNEQVLRAIAGHFDHDHPHRARLSELHTYILKHKPANQDVFDFSSTCYQIGYALVNSSAKKNYYIIGSKYLDGKTGKNVDVLPDMLKKNAISTGYLWHWNLGHLVGKGVNEFNKYATNQIPGKMDNRHASVKTLRRFVNLKPGDLIAIKSVGSFSRLTIVAYAVVKDINGKVGYTHDDPDLGHLIDVDFIETGLTREVELNYAETMHQIMPGERLGHFEAIFGSYAIQNDPSVSVFKDEDDYNGRPFDSGDPNNDIRAKDDEDYMRTINARNQLISQTHNKLQNAFAQHLLTQFPNDQIKTERGRIDIWRLNDTGFYIYEVKPYHIAYGCIRAAFGQLMDYAFSSTPHVKIHLIVVGPAKPGKKDIKYIKFLSDNLGLTFNYIHFDIQTKTADHY